ncbi:hypothetical protein XENTR_v10016955 [Xenopus tropicalis]|nr:hypothetical protein XENTR_v10016955 [Xenopus tropicalis]
MEERENSEEGDDDAGEEGEEDQGCSEDGGEVGAEREKEVELKDSLRPSVLDLQLALARLCEDEYRDQPSKMPVLGLQINEDHSFERSYSGNAKIPSPGKIVNELFKEAKEHGAIPIDDASKSSGAFYKARIQILLKLWSNGFSLDDGELRSYSDPINAEFLESVKKGEIPVELQRLIHGGQVNLDMEDHQDQEYVKPRLKFKAFSGEGKKLGSLTPEIISTPSSPEEEHKRFLNAEVDLDEHVPTTKIQIRLADGTRLIQRFNLSHRIMDVRHYIIHARSDFAQCDFALVTTFPFVELTDESQTLEEADILNTVILQRLK